ncbi:hypothetical protein FMUND_7174 [Fusarium mundagurra]|uniref:Uncharacterized protein n=1 Tax=Fusarium mundagurra TaxID=1567541 RepID=A0A8H6DEK0_9HYPO|nr:hypothetical protein FMUND_7174 [Fusarium mundagurra]
MSDYKIHWGLWHNYSLDYSEQLTLPASVGSILVASTSTFIAIAGGQLWSLIAFIVYYCRANPGEPHDGIHISQQALYKNISSPLGLVWSLIKGNIVYAGLESWKKWWRRRASPYTTRRKRRLCLFGGLPTFVWLIYTAAGPASPFLTTHRVYKGNEVLANSHNCGFEQWNRSTSQGNIAFQKNSLRIASEALNYVNNCYNSTDALSCSVLPRQNLDYAVYQISDCPFGSRCKVSPITMETGWMDSHEDFGMNAPVSDRVQMRKQATCAVVDVRDLTTLASIGNDLFRYEYDLGPVEGLSENYTAYAVERQAPDYVGYNIQPYYAFQGVDGPWTPIADFNSSDGDVSLFVIQFGIIKYESKVTDPLFSATKPLNDTSFFTPDMPAGLMACIDRYQLQNPSGSIQTTMGSVKQVTGQFQKLNFNNAQMAAAARFMLPSSLTEMYNAVNGLGVAALRAQRNVFSSVSVGLPSDQWLAEARGWFETTLAMYQLRVVSFAFKDDSQLNPYMRLNLDLSTSQKTNITSDLESMCSQQKLRNIAKWQTFSIAGLAIIAGIGGGIIILSLAVEVIVDSAWKLFSLVRRATSSKAKNKKPASNLRLEQWRLDSVSQLQRRAFQNAGQGSWERGGDDIPVLRGTVNPLGEERHELGYVSVQDETGDDRS